MTSEWSQRTALTTFTLAPRRLPVLAAKYVAAVVARPGRAGRRPAAGAGSHRSRPLRARPRWRTTAWSSTSAASIVFVVLQVTMAAAFGALAANTPVAITAFLVAPTAWARCRPDLPQSVARWFDVFGAYDQLASTRPFDQLGPSLTSVAVWVAIPAIVGVVVALRREVK